MCLALAEDEIIFQDTSVTTTRMVGEDSAKDTHSVDERKRIRIQARVMREAKPKKNPLPRGGGGGGTGMNEKPAPPRV